MLVRAAAHGDVSAFEKLYETHAQSLLNMVFRSVRDRQLAEDVSQEVWLKVYRTLPTLRDPAAFPSWLYRIAAKRCVDVARRRARQPILTECSDDLASQSDPEQAAIGRDGARRVLQSLAGLPSHQHIALFLREVENCSYKEIAAVLGISQSAVGTCLLRARRGFAAAYGDLHAPSEAPACAMIHHLLSLHLDGEATAIQDRALRTHLDGCETCRHDAMAMRATSQRYGGLALIPAAAHPFGYVAAAGSSVVVTLARMLASLISGAKTTAATGAIVVAAGAGGAVVTAKAAEVIVERESQPAAQHAPVVLPVAPAEAPNSLPAVAPEQPDGAGAISAPAIASPYQRAGPASDSALAVHVPTVQTQPAVAVSFPKIELQLPTVEDVLADPVGAVEDVVDNVPPVIEEVVEAVPVVVEDIASDLIGLLPTPEPSR